MSKLFFLWWVNLSTETEQLFLKPSTSKIHVTELIFITEMLPKKPSS